MARATTQEGQEQPKQARKKGFQPSLLSLSRKEQTKSLLSKLKAETENLIAALEAEEASLPQQSQAAILSALMHLSVLNQTVKKKQSEKKKPSR
jgi:hypothetical protein